MKNKILKGRINGLEVAFAYSDTTSAVNKAVLLHDCDPVSAHLLGRAITATSLGASLLPAEHRLSVNWKYPGKLKNIIVDVGQDGTFRAIITPSHLQNIVEKNTDIFGDIGEIKTIVRNEKKILNASSTPVSLHDPVSDLSYHFSISDQIETSITAVIGFYPNEKNPVRISRGIMIQALPDCDLDIFERLRKKTEEKKIRELLIKDKNKNMIDLIMKELIRSEDTYNSYDYNEESIPTLTCTCKVEEKFEAVLKSLPIPERMEIVREKNPLKISCEFCKKTHEISIDDCIKYWNKK